MRKSIQILLVSLFIFTIIPSSMVVAEDYSDTAYWESYCEGYKNEPDGSDKKVACRKYYAHVSQGIIDGFKDDLDSLKNDKEKLQKELGTLIDQSKEVQKEIEKLDIEINDLVSKITVLEADIAKKEAEVDVLNRRVLDRMKATQSTMHFNPYLDFLLGAANFEEMLRRGYGLDTIMQSDEEMRDELKGVIESLEKDKLTLKSDKELLDEQKYAVDQRKAYIEEVKALTENTLKEVNAKIDETLSNLEEEYQNYENIISSGDLEGLPSSEGFIRPLPGASISAGVWHYPESFGGGVHLGVDYAVGKGSRVLAPATGVVLISSDGCGDGWLGNTCGFENGGEIYGGNQIYLIVAAGGKIYGVIFCHLLLNSLTVSEGDIVVQGQQIAQVGSSGNSTGPHSHVELFYLGEGELEDIPDYLQNSYTKSFNCGWGSTALRRLCENGVGAPCRLNPANYL